MSELLAQNRAELLRFLAARCGSREEAEDLLQDMWLKAAAIASGPIANGRAYLFRMANNLVLDRRREQQRAMARDRGWLREESGSDLPPDLRPDSAERADDALARAEEAEMIRRAIAQLPPGARRALQLHRIDGFPQGEVARMLGISRSGVEKHLAVAMKRLREALHDCGFFAPAASAPQERGGGGIGAEDTPS